MDPSRFQSSTLQIIKADYDHPSLFQRRCHQLLQIDSDHFLAPRWISKEEGKYILMTYLRKQKMTLRQRLQGEELLHNQLRSIIWQITRFMLHCQQQKINHFRLNLDTVMIQQEKEGGNMFVLVKDFSFGREQRTEQNLERQTNIFQFQHPSIWIQGSFHSFNPIFYNSRYDIWSLGVILYHLIYKQTPFREKDQDNFSLTVLKHFFNDEEQTQLQFDRKHKSFNAFILKCLTNQFHNWQQIKQYLITEEESFNQIDFDLSFDQLAKKHFQLMFVFTSIFSLIHKEVKYSFHHIWTEQKEMEGFPFPLYLAQDTLILMKHINLRFNDHYGAFFHLLEQKDKELLLGLRTVNQSIRNEFLHLEGKWKTKFQAQNQQKHLTSYLLEKIKKDCAQMKINSDVIKKKNNRSPKPIWKSLEQIFSFSSGVIDLLNKSQHRMKDLFELCYSSKLFQQLKDEFEFPAKEMRVRSRHESL